MMQNKFFLSSLGVHFNIMAVLAGGVAMAFLFAVAPIPAAETPLSGDHFTTPETAANQNVYAVLWTPLTGDHFTTQEGDLIIHPVNHASLIMSWQGQTIYVDPVGGAQRYDGLPRPDLILLTDIHGDHLHAATLTGVAGPKTALVAPQAVVDLLPGNLRERATVMANGQTKTILKINIDALPMYNLAPERAKYHPKGRGNGYLLSFGGKRVYLSGDTEDIPEMRALKNIDVAFLCMNLPFTMDVDHAASAVRALGESSPPRTMTAGTVERAWLTIL